LTDVWSPDEPRQAASAVPDRRTREAKLPSLIRDLPTPALLLDRQRLQANLDRMAKRLSGFGVGLRPHMKTAKSADVMRLALKGQFGGIVVQTVAEAEYFAAHGCRDILYAVSIVPNKLDRLAALEAHGATITLICDDLAAANAVQRASDALGASFPVLIEIDADGTRSGIRADDPDLVPLAAALSRGPGTAFAGVLCHAGSAYDAKNHDDIVRAAETERRAAVDASEVIRRAGIDCPTVSVGSTPSACCGERYDGVTEVRAGVYMFQDLSLVELGTCQRPDIAMTVLATVVAHNRNASTLIVDAGAIALSKDPGFTDREKVHYGELIDPLSEEPLGLVVGGMSQEHGIIDVQSADFDRLPIGSMVRILPNHACLTAAAHRGYHVMEGGKIVDYWPTAVGW
jgi:D-serine deaminase-like pyridoxal phosphate-dependent protein